MSLVIHRDLIQGSDEWLAARCGLLTASEMKLILTPSLKPASNDKERAHLWELAAQRITRHVEPHYVGDDMLRGFEDEAEARALYAERYAPVEEVGFMVRDFGGVSIGYSPDGLVGADGLIEVKSRRQRFQVETICGGAVPADYALQIQTGLMVSGRAWCDFISYSGGLPMLTLRVFPDAAMAAAILEAALAFEERLNAAMERFGARLRDGTRLIPTQRRIEQEMVV